MGVAQALVTVDGRETATWVVFGEDESGEALLGAYTLEGALLNVDLPLIQRLVPAIGSLRIPFAVMAFKVSARPACWPMRSSRGGG